MKRSLQGEELLNSPLHNKGTAFTKEERDRFHLHGLLPVHISTMEEQVQRCYQNFSSRPDPLSKYLFLSTLQNHNETLFYRLVSEHVTEMLPFIYTPTVGDISLRFSALYQQHRGVYLSYALKDRIESIVASLPREEVDVIVATDGERVLGLGDMGIGGMAIPIGKLSLYTLFGGVNPSRTLPVMLDVGTDNPELLSNPLYLGCRHARIRGAAYDAFIDLFVRAVKKRYPHVLLQWEDFAKAQAFPLLQRYKDQICSFNDDIQGTAAAVLAGLLSALKVQNKRLKDQKIAILGGGSAGVGIAELLCQEMQAEGLTEQEALQNFYIVDLHGLLHTKSPHMDAQQRRFAHSTEELAHWKVKDPAHIPLIDLIHQVRPAILLGVSTQKGAFTKEIVTAMRSYIERPILFPLSNPTTQSEAHPKDLLEWTQGSALIATGSPFEDVTPPISQCNNVYIFPGVGLGILSAKIPKVTQGLFLAAARILSEHSPALTHGSSALFPPFTALRSISRKIAIGVILQAGKEGLCPPTSQKEAERAVDATMWTPEYSLFLS